MSFYEEWKRNPKKGFGPLYGDLGEEWVNFVTDRQIYTVQNKNWEQL